MIDLKSPKRATGFTLIELLIVVAIIAILAAIAVPNFLEAQTRAKVSRVQADLRSIATALEAYRVDFNHYPPTPFVNGGDNGVLHVVPDRLASPIAFLSSVQLEDPFIAPGIGDFQMIRTTLEPGRRGDIASWTPDLTIEGEPRDARAGRRYYYRSHRDARRNIGLQTAFLRDVVPHQGDWILVSLGPDRRRNVIFVGDVPGIRFDTHIPYDPTNGTVSEGDIIRTQRQSVGTLSN